MTAIKALIITMFSNLTKMVFGPKFILWIIARSAAWTDNKVDDHVVDIMQAAYNNDEQALKHSTDALLTELKG